MDSDLKLNNGDLGYNAAGDLNIVSDIDNIWQGINLRLTTKLGNNMFAGNKYGTNLGDYVDEDITDSLKQKIIKEVKKSIIQDSRISSVANVKITSSTSKLILYLTVILSNGVVTKGNVTIGG